MTSHEEDLRNHTLSLLVKTFIYLLLLLTGYNFLLTNCIFGNILFKPW